MKRAARRRASACAIARAATWPATAPRPRHPTGPNAGISARPMPPNIIATGTISPAFSAEEAARRAADEAEAPPASASRRNGNGRARATAAGAATKCARSTRSVSTATPSSRTVKAAYRKLAKENHPDLKPGDNEAAQTFKQVQAAYDVLRKAEERREGKAA